MFKKQDNATGITATSSTSSTISSGPKPTIKQSPSSKLTQASIGASIRIKGEIIGEEDLEIHGEISGTIALPKHMLIVGKDGSINADVDANSVDILGSVSGTVKACELVVVKASGRVIGDIIAPRVVLEDGCQFRGGIEMKEQVKKQAKASAKSNDVVKSSSLFEPAMHKTNAPMNANKST